MARNAPREGNPLKDKSITRRNFSTQPGEFTLPGRLRALPRRQSHSLAKEPCGTALRQSPGSSYSLPSQEPGLCSAGTSTAPKSNSSSRDVVQQNSPVTNLPPSPGCVPALPCSGASAPRSRCQGKRRADPQHKLKRALVRGVLQPRPPPPGQGHRGSQQPQNKVRQRYAAARCD